jgi:protein TonB
VLHAALLFSAGNLVSQNRPAAKMTEDLKVRLVAPPPLSAPDPAPQPELHMREDTSRKPVTAPLQKPRLTRPPESSRAGKSPAGIQMLAGDAARKAGEQIARELFYPPEAIERGLEGEALVLLFLDESGNAIAARIEASSGHALLDAAAVRAARTLRAMPASAPREAVLPVRFRLR